MQTIFLISLTNLRLGEWLPAILVALITLFGSVREANLRRDFEEKWENKRMNADLIAKSRLKWIEEVRSSTSVFISDLMELKNGKQQDSSRIRTIKSNAELLKLYFSSSKPEVLRTFSIKKVRKELNCTIDNKGKNKIIVSFIDHLVRIYEQEYYSKKKEMYLQETMVKELKKKILDLEEDTDYHPIYNEDADEEFMQPTARRIPDKYEDIESSYWSQIQEAQTIINKNTKKIEQFDNELSYFREIMALYLKIEWERAKKAE